MSQGITEHKYTTFIFLCHFLHGLEDIIFFTLQNIFSHYWDHTASSTGDALCLQEEKTVGYKGKKIPLTQQDPQFLQQKKDDNLKILLNTCLGSVKRHKLVGSHL